MNRIIEGKFGVIPRKSHAADQENANGNGKAGENEHPRHGGRQPFPIADEAETEEKMPSSELEDQQSLFDQQ